MPFASGSQRGCVGSARVWGVVAAALGPLAAPAPAVERDARRLPMPSPSVVVGLTAPSRVATLAAVIPARIARLPAAEGRPTDLTVLGGLATHYRSFYHASEKD